MKTCTGCDKDKPNDDFPEAWRRPDGRASRCRACTTARAQKWRHGLTQAERQIIADEQGGCAICGHAEPGGKGWCVDHDRSCCPGDKSCPKCRRGIVCLWCNACLGYAFDRPQILEAAADYLRAHEVRRSAGAGAVA